MPDEETLADIYEATDEIMNAANIPAYEVSNYARAGGECRHNLAYWRYDDYIGIGPGAHGRFTENKKKYESITLKSPEKWLESVAAKGHGINTLEALANESIAEEYLLMGLRIKEGINIKSFPEKTGYDLFEVINKNKLENFVTEGLLELSADHMRASKSGMLVLDKLTAELLT